MSHAWGQTVPSNYGRLPPSRQREFHTDAGLGEAGERVIKQIMEDLTEKVSAEVTQELEGKVQKAISAEVVAEAQEKTLLEIGEDASAETIEKLYKKNLKEIVGESGEAAAKDLGKDITVKAARDGTEKTIKKTVEAVPETAIERLGKRAITVGGIGITGFAMFNSFLNSDALDGWVASTTGRDCDEKAEEAGLEPGTQEYTDNVSACQEKAVENMAFLGKAITYGGLGIGALVAVSILSKIGIFKGSKSSDDEE